MGFLTFLGFWPSFTNDIPEELFGDELLTSNRLHTAADLRDYLSYSIKIFELARKYTWESVLKYDDEYRILQHTCGYPWSFDNS